MWLARPLGRIRRVESVQRPTHVGALAVGWGYSHENSYERANNARALTCAETERIEISHVRENGVFALQTREK